MEKIIINKSMEKIFSKSTHFNFFKKSKKKSKLERCINITLSACMLLIADFLFFSTPLMFQLDEIVQYQAKNTEILHYKNFYENDDYRIKDLKTLLIEQKSDMSSLLLSKALINVISNPNINETLKKESVQMYNLHYMDGANAMQKKVDNFSCAIVSPSCNYIRYEFKKGYSEIKQKVITQINENKKVINGEMPLNNQDEKTTNLIYEHQRY